MLEMPGADLARVALAARLAPPALLSDSIGFHQRRSPVLAIELTGALGLVERLGWLSEVLEDPRYGTQAAQVFRLITGAPGSPSTGEELHAWLEANAARFVRQERYLAGVAITPQAIGAQLRNGKQGIRAHAAFEAARSGPGEPVLNTCAPAFRQLAVLRRAYL
jgi:hypothetical protein